MLKKHSGSACGTNEMRNTSEKMAYCFAVYQFPWTKIIAPCYPANGRLQLSKVRCQRLLDGFSMGFLLVTFSGFTSKSRISRWTPMTKHANISKEPWVAPFLEDWFLSLMQLKTRWLTGRWKQKVLRIWASSFPSLVQIQVLNLG